MAKKEKTSYEFIRWYKLADEFVCGIYTWKGRFYSVLSDPEGLEFATEQELTDWIDNYIKEVSNGR